MVRFWTSVPALIEGVARTGSIDSIVDAAELFHRTRHEMIDLLCAGDICPDSQNLGFAGTDRFLDQFLRSLEALLVSVAEDELGAAFAGERDGRCLADACDVCFLACDPGNGFWIGDSPDAAPVMSATPG